MDLELLSRMVGELLIEYDQVGLPGVGTFVAEMVPASFSDKGFTINPPYRRLSFSPGQTEESLLIDFYADSNQVDREAAAVYVTQYLAELKSVLMERKTVALPGLGRLRATRENAIFFVADEGLDIFPAGIGLRPVSLKSHLIQDDPVVIRVPLPIRMEVPQEASETIPEEPVAEESLPEEPQTEQAEGLRPTNRSLSPKNRKQSPKNPNSPRQSNPSQSSSRQSSPCSPSPSRKKGRKRKKVCLGGGRSCCSSSSWPSWP